MKLPYIFDLTVLACCFTWLILGFSRGGTFSLKKLFILITVIAILLGFTAWASRRRQKRTAVETRAVPTLAIDANRK
jgi:hypothetical protein